MSFPKHRHYYGNIGLIKTRGRFPDKDISTFIYDSNSRHHSDFPKDKIWKRYNKRDKKEHLLTKMLHYIKIIFRNETICFIPDDLVSTCFNLHPCLCYKEVTHRFPETSSTCSSVACDSSAGILVSLLSRTQKTFRRQQPPIWSQDMSPTQTINMHQYLLNISNTNCLFGGGKATEFQVNQFLGTLLWN